MRVCTALTVYAWKKDLGTGVMMLAVMTIWFRQAFHLSPGLTKVISLAVQPSWSKRLLVYLIDLLYHNEPIIMNGEAVGYLTSGMYGHSLNAAIGMGYVNAPELTAEKISTAEFAIEVAGERFSAQASLKSLFDPEGSRMKC